MYSVTFGLNGSLLVFRVLFPGVVGHDLPPPPEKKIISKHFANIH